jgi:hypothetical protein
VAPEFFESPLVVKAIEGVGHRPVPRQQDRAQRGEPVPELPETILDEGEMSGGPFGRRQDLGLVHVQTDHRPSFRGFGEGCVVRDPQVALEPDDGAWHPK